MAKKSKRCEDKAVVETKIDSINSTELKDGTGNEAKKENEVIIKGCGRSCHNDCQSSCQ